jgi:hypothetical protein
LKKYYRKFAVYNMNKMLTFLILVFCISIVPAMSVLSAAAIRKPLLSDGFTLTGIEGKLFKKDSNDVWFFTFDPAVTDSSSRAGIEAALELLPSYALEKMIADVNTSSATNYRLWGRITKYRGENFIFPNYFLPIGKIGEPNSLRQQPFGGELRAELLNEQEAQPTVAEPNDDLGIPKEILEKLRTRQSPPLAARQQTERLITIKQNSVLANRIGFLVRQTDGNIFFNFDALGRSLQQTSLRLLPCQTLELAERRQSAEPDPIRFKIAGIVTEYKGEKFLLLHRATRVYSHGNFGR